MPFPSPLTPNNLYFLQRYDAYSSLARALLATIYCTIRHNGLTLATVVAAIGLALASPIPCMQAWAATPIIVAAPEAQDMPTTATSYPFLAAKHNLVPLDLAASGYEERETLVSGRANVYDWSADGKPVVKSTHVPYATRILVRLPKDKARFSGVVVVEAMYDARSSDWAMLWGYLHEKIVRDGDIWVGVTLPKSTPSLKNFDPARYAAVTFAPATPLTCKTNESGDTMEEGLRFDMLAQVGALLKRATPSNPLAGYGPTRRLFMTAQGVDVATYATAFQTLERLRGGLPIYDGFLLKSQSGALAKLNHCGQGLPATDPRSALKNIGVPVIAVIAPGEVLGSLATRRDDSDDKADRYRRYEVAASNHLDRNGYVGFPSLEDQTKAGVAQGTVDWPFNARCTPEIQLSEIPLSRYIFDSTLNNLATWSKGGPAPPRAARIALKKNADGAQAVALDASGVAQGGLRTVFSDLPTAVDTLGSPGPGNCREIGGTVRFSWAYLSSLYGSPQAYAAKALAMIDAMEKDRWLTSGDANLLRAEITAAPKPPGAPGN